MASSSKRISVPTSGGDRNVKTKSCELDYDTLDCPVCLEPLAAPVYQCPIGHTACGDCCKKLLDEGKCPWCSLPIGTNRCIAVEKIVESVQVLCKYATFGCKNMMQYSKQKIRHDHEDVCKFRPYLCPGVGCHLEVPKSNLLDHFRKNHKGRIFFYQKPEDDGPLDEVIKCSFTFSTNKDAYDKTLSQYLIVQVSGDQDSEDQDSEDQDSEDQDSEDQDPDQDHERGSKDQLFLVHLQFNQCTFQHSFSLTSFGTCCFDYSLSITVERDGHWPVGRSRRSFMYNYSIGGPVYDNQRDGVLLREVVQKGDCLSILRLPSSQRDSSKFEVEFQIGAHTRLFKPYIQERHPM